MIAMRPMGWPQNGPIEGSEKKKGSRRFDVNPYAAKCRRQDLNLHCLATTRPSTWRVCQFRHSGAAQFIMDAHGGSSSVFLKPGLAI